MLSIRRARRSTATAVAATLLLASVVAVLDSPPASGSTTVNVLHVGSWNGHTGEFASIADAAAAAHPGDWILVGPGDYKERADYSAPSGEAGAGLSITTPGLHIRGMDRNGVVVDGTKPGSPQCSSAPGDQDLGPGGAGRDGVVTFKVDGVSIDNLTACNFLSGSGGGGNEIWFNGGDGSGQTGMNDYAGSYLSATSSYYSDANSPEYGIFVSNVNGPGSLTHTYGSNMADGAYYIGACQDCNTLVDDAHAQYSALGYSGTNSGGRLLIQNSEFDNNKTGFSTNSQNNDDAPSPQDGHCPGDLLGPTGTSSCWVFRNNSVHDNNDTTAPGKGTAELGPIGTGLVISGGRFDTVTGNRFENNGSWAVLVVPYIDTGTPPPIAHCDGGVDNWLGLGWCYYATWGNEISGNTFSGNGTLANPTNGDLGDISDPDPAEPGNCYHGNTDAGGLSSAPADIESSMGSCGVANQGGVPLDINKVLVPDPNSLVSQVVCASGVFGPCPDLPSPPYPPNTPTGIYPAPESPVLPALQPQTTMPDPCAGVPGDSWCPPHPGITVSPTTVTPGSSFTVTSTGWSAGGPVAATLGGVALGTLTADIHGTVTGTFPVPTNLALGEQLLSLTGESWDGLPLTQTATLTIAAAAPPASATPTAASFTG